MKIKAIYIKNLKMPEGKVAAQVAHAVKNLGITPTDCDIVVLSVSRKKFDELVKEHSECYVQVDKGLTVVKSGTKTAAAWIDQNEIKTLTYDEVASEISSANLFEDVIFEYKGNNYRFSFKHYQYMVDEYGVEDISQLSCNFKNMLSNGIYIKCK